MCELNVLRRPQNKVLQFLKLSCQRTSRNEFVFITPSIKKSCKNGRLRTISAQRGKQKNWPYEKVCHCWQKFPIVMMWFARLRHFPVRQCQGTLYSEYGDRQEPPKTWLVYCCVIGDGKLGAVYGELLQLPCAPEMLMFLMMWSLIENCVWECAQGADFDLKFSDLYRFTL